VTVPLGEAPLPENRFMLVKTAHNELSTMPNGPDPGVSLCDPKRHLMTLHFGLPRSITTRSEKA
jgi:hypothetical protein